MAKKAHSRRMLLRLIVIGILTAFSYSIFRYNNPSVDFTYYEPHYLPPNVSVKAKRISIVFDKIHVEQNFRTEDWVYSITEQKFWGGNAYDVSLGNYDPKSILPTCSVANTPNNTTFRL